MDGFPWLSAVTFAPVAGAVILAFIPPRAVRLHRSLALVFSLLTFGVSLGLLGLHRAGPGLQLVERASWVAPLNFQYILGVDGISLFLVLLTTFLMPLAVLASWPVTTRAKPYFVFLMALETGMLGVFAALDLFLFYLFWEASLVPMYFLIGMWGYGRRIYAAMKFFLFTLAGSLLMLVAILFLYFAAREPTFSYTELLGTPLTIGSQRLLFRGFFASFAVKVPRVPFHTWLPDAHTEAPTAGSVLLAAVLLNLGD